MRWIILIIAIYSTAAKADAVDELEIALKNNNIQEAKKCVDDIHHGRNTGFFTNYTEQVTKYYNLVSEFEHIDNTNKLIESYRNTKNEDDYRAAIGSWNPPSEKRSYPVSKEVVDALNTKIKQTRDDLATIKAIHKAEVEKKAQIARQEEQQRQAAWDAARAKEDESARIAIQEQEEYDKKQAAEEERRSKLCGKDFRRIFVGMTKKRFLLCNPAQLYAARAGDVQIYQSATGMLVTVSNGKVYSWIAR